MLGVPQYLFMYHSGAIEAIRQDSAVTLGGK